MALEEAKIRERTAQARKDAGLTQEQAAELFEVHKRTIENWENNYVPYDRLNDIATTYGTSSEFLLWGNDLPPAATDAISRIVDEARAAIAAEATEFRRSLSELEERLRRHLD